MATNIFDRTVETAWNERVFYQWELALNFDRQQGNLLFVRCLKKLKPPQEAASVYFSNDLPKF